MAIMHHMHFMHYMHDMHGGTYLKSRREKGRGTEYEQYYCNQRDELYFGTSNIFVIIFKHINTSYFRFSSFFDKKPGAYFPDSQFSFLFDLVRRNRRDSGEPDVKREVKRDGEPTSSLGATN